jgi:hypothetical protein
MKPVKNAVAVASLAMFCAALAATPALSQEQDAKQGSAAGATPHATPVAKKHVRSPKNVDARHCLKFSTNLEIHKCALKYL